jgi:hypothetical protein
MLAKIAVLVVLLGGALQASELSSLASKLSEMAVSGVPDADVTRLLRLRAPFKPNNHPLQLPLLEGKSEKAKASV